eukprot:TRINITY_DN5412_c0_g1_i4.p1 TRINITY_DN5412_c0_g1~~TRINITY_DN5412_c0_g1_i4.p1  ORF type:complete len:115 (+),score=10.16 TRINITY_DN5412_c0_g1_i4:259-603(+)
MLRRFITLLLQKGHVSQIAAWSLHIREYHFEGQPNLFWRDRLCWDVFRIEDRNSFSWWSDFSPHVPEPTSRFLSELASPEPKSKEGIGLLYDAQEVAAFQSGNTNYFHMLLAFV